MVVEGEEGLGARSPGCGARSLLASPAVYTATLGWLLLNIGLDVFELV